MSDEHERELKTGKCVGGPCDGEEYTTRKPEGITFVDRGKGEAAIYEWTDGVFKHRETVPLDEDKRVKTADEWRFEVIPYGD